MLQRNSNVAVSAGVSGSCIGEHWMEDASECMCDSKHTAFCGQGLSRYRLWSVGVQEEVPC